MTIKIKHGATRDGKIETYTIRLPGGLVLHPTVGNAAVNTKKSSAQASPRVKPVVMRKITSLPKRKPSRGLHSWRFSSHDMPTIGELMTPHLQGIPEQENPHYDTRQQLEDTLFHISQYPMIVLTCQELI